MRGPYHYRHTGEYSDRIDRILCVVSYLTCGWGGFIWLAITHFRGKMLSSFARYHIFQAIFLSIIIYVFSLVTGIIAGVAGIIPVIGDLTINIIESLTLKPFLFGRSIFHLLIFAVYLYLICTTIMGKYAKLPWISNIVRQMN